LVWPVKFQTAESVVLNVEILVVFELF